jgi:hypothetical protein
MRDVMGECERARAPASTGYLEVGLSRRVFVAGVVAGGAVAAAFPHTFVMAANAPCADPAPLSPVVGFCMDRPYLDLSGTAKPYIAPPGTRSGQALANLSETEYLTLHPYG